MAQVQKRPIPKWPKNKDFKSPPIHIINIYFINSDGPKTKTLKVLPSILLTFILLTLMNTGDLADTTSRL